MSVGLDIKLERLDQKIILHLEGRIDASSAMILEKKLDGLLKDKHSQLLLDFTSLLYLSSAGLRVLLSFSKQLDVKKGFLLLYSIPDDVFEIIKMAGFDKVLHICSSEKEALQFYSK